MPQLYLLTLDVSLFVVKRQSNMDRPGDLVAILGILYVPTHHHLVVWYELANSWDNWAQISDNYDQEKDHVTVVVQIG